MPKLNVIITNMKPLLQDNKSHHFTHLEGSFKEQHLKDKTSSVLSYASEFACSANLKGQ